MLIQSFDVKTGKWVTILESDWIRVSAPPINLTLRPSGDGEGIYIAADESVLLRPEVSNALAILPDKER